MVEKNVKSSMEKEIFEQPKILENISNTHLNDANYILFDVPKDVEKIVFVASGSSYHCSRYGADLFGKVADMEARAIYSSEFLLKPLVPHSDNILYVFITQSGETSDTNKALIRAKELGMKTLAITNKEGSSIWKASDFKINCHAGEEKSIAATKSLTSQMMCVTLLALKYATFKGKDISQYIEDLKNLPSFLIQILSNRNEIEKLAKKISKFKLLVATADGMSYAIAKEASLKIKETSYICTISNILGEFMNGHVALFNNKSAQIHLSVEPLSEVAVNNLKKINAEYKTPLFLLGADCEELKTEGKFIVETPSYIVNFFALVVASQLLSLNIAQNLGRNVDKPHGLDKVVK